jgi:hypothetical protein
MDAARQINSKPTNGGPNPGLLRPPIIFIMRDSSGDRPEPSLAALFRVTRCSVARS